ncbi:hypothetical protein SARC_01539, partial [Sphaeroforma arctica JP610]
MDQMIKAVKPANEWKVLVIDDHTTRIISSAVRMYDITDNGVTVVEQLSKVRQPLRHYEAIYFVKPCAESFKKIEMDFQNNFKYAAIHLFTSSACPDDLFKSIAKSNAAKYIKTFSELNIDFLANEKQHSCSSLSAITLLRFRPQHIALKLRFTHPWANP